MSRFFNIQFNDLSFDKQEELIDEIVLELLESWEEETKGFGTEDKKKNWHEAYCRVYDIEYQMWETEEEAKVFDWEYAIQDYARSEAELRLHRGLKYAGVEVEI